MDLEIATTRPGAFQKFLEKNILPERVIILNWREWDYTSIHRDPTFEEVVDYVNLHNLPLYVVSGECPGSPPLHDINNPRYKNMQVIYFGTYLWTIFAELFFKDVDKVSDIKDPLSKNRNKEIKHLFFSLNNKPHHHRCLQMDLLEKYSLIEKGAVTWNSWFNDEGRILGKSFDSYHWEYWQPRLMVMDEMISHGWETQLPNEFSHSFIHLVSESSPTAMLLSEKSLIPLLFNKPFLVSGAKGFHQNLQNMGFLLYDELFDYSFDNELDMKNRFDLLTQNIVKYKDCTSQELEALRQQVQEKTVHNKRNLFRVISDLSLWPEFIKNLCESKVDNRDEDNIYSFYQGYKHGIITID